VGAIALLAARALPHLAGTARALDPRSMALNALAFGPLVVGAELLPTAPVLAVILFVAAALGAAALVRREIPKEAPLIPLDLLRAPPFRVSVIASVCCFIGQTAGLVALPFYLQHGLAQSPMMTGLYMTPWPLTVAVTAPIVGRLANRVSTACSAPRVGPVSRPVSRLPVFGRCRATPGRSCCSPRCAASVSVSLTCPITATCFSRRHASGAAPREACREPPGWWDKPRALLL
jgi:hypothetical protein